MSVPAISLTLEQIVATLGGDLVGPGHLQVRRVMTLDAAEGDAIAFLASSKYRKQLESTRAGAVILGPSERDATEKPRIVSDNPYAYFARVSALLNPGPAHIPGAHPSAQIHPSAFVAASASIGACACVGPGAEIGERVILHPGVVVGENCRIGDGSTLNANVVIYHDCVIGKNCVLHAGVVIGGDGFGMAEEKGRWIKVPQVGRTVIGDDVEIGANSAIDRGALGDTIIEDGVKLDNLIQVGHNVIIGAHTAIAACTGIAGSTRIGRGCKIGGAAMIHGHIEICDHAIVAAGTMVRKSITEPGLYDGFFPALPHRDWMKNLAHFGRLHELADRVRQLETRLQDIERNKK